MSSSGRQVGGKWLFGNRIWKPEQIILTGIILSVMARLVRATFTGTVRRKLARTRPGHDD